MAEKILSKTQSDTEGFICVRRSIVQKGDKENILAVQLHNGSDYVIDGVSLRVEFLDHAGGTVHETKEITIDGLMGLPGDDFILPDISMPSSREAANIKIYAVTSGDYYYRISNDGQSAESETLTRKKIAAVGAESKISGGARNKIYAIYAVFIVALFIAALAVVFSGLLSGGESSANDAVNIEIVREIGDQNVETRETC